MVIFKLEDFECIEPKYVEQLHEKLNIVNVDDFYKVSYVEILKNIAVDAETVQKWIDVLEIFKIPKITPRFAGLLYYCNINSIEELAHSQASRILYKLKELDVESRLIILNYPTFAQIDEWIYFAKMMIKKIKYCGSIPLILIKNFNLDITSNLAEYGIYTLDDFIYRKDMIKGLRKKVLKMKKHEYLELINFINILRIDGVHLKIAKLLWYSGYKNINLIKETNKEQLLEDLKHAEDTTFEYKKSKIRKREIKFTITINESLIDKIKQNVIILQEIH